MAAPRDCGSFHPSTALAYFPEEQKEESGADQREAPARQLVSEDSSPKPRAVPPKPSPVAQTQGAAGPSYFFAWKYNQAEKYFGQK